jgi:hypothetical protein
MLRRFLAIAFWAATLAASATAGESTPTIRGIQNGAASQCSFLPTASTISAILSKNNATLQTEAQIVSAVCAAVNANNNRRAPPIVDGVVIRGCPVRR